MAYVLKTTIKILLILTLLNPFYAIHAATEKNKDLLSIDDIVIPTKKESGLTLDIARHFYPIDVIKAFIDDIKNAGGTFLHLHFSDHENYAIESNILDQLTHNALKDSDGNYINPNTGKAFLSYEQLKDIITYAKERKIEIIPEVGSPNHMTAIFTLLEKKHGKDYVQSIKSKWNDEELDITNPESITFIKTLMSEVIDIFIDNTRYFHIGGDEFGYSVESNHEFINYANQLTEFLSEKGLTTRMWNDGVIKATLDQLNKNIQITYWSYDGDTENKNEADKRRQIRASVPELLKKGFSILNYNSYYLYINPEQGETTAHNSNFAMRDVLENWDLGIWDAQNQHNKVLNTDNILGASFTIWGEDAGSLSGYTIQKYNRDLLGSIIRKTNANTSLENDSQKIEALSKNKFSNLQQKNYIDLSQTENNLELQLDEYNQIIYLLHEDNKKDITLWVKGFPNNQLVLEAHWQLKPSNYKHYQLYEYNNKKLWVDKNITMLFENK